MAAGQGQVDDRLRARLDELLTRLCSIPSPSGREGAVRALVSEIAAASGFTEQVIDAAGNLHAGRPGRAAGGRLVLCSHLDTVPHGEIPIEPVLVDDRWENRHAAILGADNKAAVAVMLACVERLAESGGSRLADVALLFTVEEEDALAGASACDMDRLEGDSIYVFDHATAIGEVIIASPSYFRIDAKFVGKAAHAGICPERGRSAIRAAARAIAAMPHGRLDAETTVNAGHVHGGEAGGTNIVADRCDMAIEVRSLSESRAEQVVSEVVDCLHAAGAEGDDQCDLHLTVERRFSGYRHDRRDPVVTRAVQALERCGFSADLVESGGASDVNAFVAGGIGAVCLANGTRDPHQPSESVSRAALAEMAAVTFELIAG